MRRLSLGVSTFALLVLLPTPLWAQTVSVADALNSFGNFPGEPNGRLHNVFLRESSAALPRFRRRIGWQPRVDPRPSDGCVQAHEGDLWSHMGRFSHAERAQTIQYRGFVSSDRHSGL